MSVLPGWCQAGNPGSTDVCRWYLLQRSKRCQRLVPLPRPSWSQQESICLHLLACRPGPTDTQAPKQVAAAKGLPTSSPSLHRSLWLALLMQPLATPCHWDHPTAGLLGWATCPPALLVAANCCRPAGLLAAAATLHIVANHQVLKQAQLVAWPPSGRAAQLLLHAWLLAAGCCSGVANWVCSGRAA
jgi:hypothetical protein